MQIWTARCPQGYKFRTCGDLKRELVDVEGVALVRTRPPKAKKKARKAAHDDQAHSDTGQ